MRIAIIDDNEKDANSLSAAARLWAEKSGIPASIDIFPSAEAFSFRFIENRDVDLLLLDVEMEGEDGIALAKRLREEGCGAEIVFVTSHFELAGEGYDVDALHYLVVGDSLSSDIRFGKNIGADTCRIGEPTKEADFCLPGIERLADYLAQKGGIM